MRKNKMVDDKVFVQTIQQLLGVRISKIRYMRQYLFLRPGVLQVDTYTSYIAESYHVANDTNKEDEKLFVLPKIFWVLIRYSSNNTFH